ncbi:MAG: hypothetical protein ACO23R_19330, partial [bacterium]
MEMIDILNKLREFEQPVNEATITPQQIEAFKQWHEKYSKMKTKDVYNYAEGIFKAHMETGDTELDGYSRQDPEGKAYDELNAIFPEMKAEVEEIGNALRAKGIDPFSGEKFSEGTQVTEADDKQLAQELAKYFQDRADSYPKRQHGDQEHEEMTSIADAFRTQGLQAGMDDINTSRFEFSSNPFNQDDFGEIDDNMMMLLKKHGVSAKMKGDLTYLTKGGKRITNPVADPYSEGAQTEGEFKKIATDKAEKERLTKLLKDKKAEYEAAMAGQGSGVGKEEKLEDEIEEIEKSLGITREGKEMKKEIVKEAIQMSADTPQEANVLMQILKLAGIEPKPVDDQMINPAEQEGCGCDDNCSCGGNCGADCD